MAIDYSPEVLAAANSASLLGGRLTRAGHILLSLVGRYYDPSTDQFLSVDPMVAETGQPYAFTGDDPLNATDPLGMCGGPDGICTNPNTGQIHVNTSDDRSDSSSAAKPLLVPVQHPGKPVVVVDGESITVTVEADVTVAGPNPYSNFLLKTNGSVEFDNGRVSLSSNEAWAEVISGPCAVRVNAFEFSCTISSRTIHLGPEAVQADIVATEEIHAPHVGLDTAEEEVLGVSSAIVGTGVALGKAVATFCEGSGAPICAG